jgi:hypothetical protein
MMKRSSFLITILSFIIVLSAKNIAFAQKISGYKKFDTKGGVGQISTARNFILPGPRVPGARGD